MLGVVLNEMKKYELANNAFEKALELDPNYFNAVSKLLSNYERLPKLQQQKTQLITKALKFAPYEEIQDIFEQRTDLVQAWVDANNIPKSPLELPPLDWEFQQNSDQYSSTNEYPSTTQQAMDGWSKEELLYNNQFVDTLGSDL